VVGRAPRCTINSPAGVGADSAPARYEWKPRLGWAGRIVVHRYQQLSKGTRTMKKAYLLLYDNSDGSVLLAIKSDNAIYAPGAPGFFGGTRDFDDGSDGETIRREFREETGDQILLSREATFQKIASTQAGHYNFYCTSDFVIQGARNLSAFRPTKEVKDVLSISAVFLKQHSATLSELGNTLLMLCGTEGAKSQLQFKQSDTLKVLRHWLTKIFDPTPHTVIDLPLLESLDRI
jgi:8-oxo-dGTP pyrophosphatase MutT (NUDIX family)